MERLKQNIEILEQTKQDIENELAQCKRDLFAQEFSLEFNTSLTPIEYWQNQQLLIVKAVGYQNPEEFWNDFCNVQYYRGDNSLYMKIWNFLLNNGKKFENALQLEFLFTKEIKTMEILLESNKSTILRQLR
jgi:hypothetical protein